MFYFPVSAFGEHELVQTDKGKKELPKQVHPQLLSFGLEDGFVWLARRKNEIDVEEFTQFVKSYDKLSFNPFEIHRKMKTLQYGKELQRRFEKNKKENLLIEKSLKSYRRNYKKSIISVFLLILLMILSVESIFDGVNYRKFIYSINNTQLSEIDIIPFEQKMDQYSKSSFIFHRFYSLILPKKRAQEIISESRKKRENTIWSTVEKADEGQSKVEAAKKYLETYPNGNYWADANRIILLTEQKFYQRKNEEALKEIENNYQSANNQIDKLNELLVNIKNLPPFPKYEIGDQSKRRVTLQEKLSSDILKIEEIQSWKNLSQVIMSKCRRKISMKPVSC